MQNNRNPLYLVNDVKTNKNFSYSSGFWTTVVFSTFNKRRMREMEPLPIVTSDLSKWTSSEKRIAKTWAQLKLAKPHFYPWSVQFYNKSKLKIKIFIGKIDGQWISHQQVHIEARGCFSNRSRSLKLAKLKTSKEDSSDFEILKPWEMILEMFSY